MWSTTLRLKLLQGLCGGVLGTQLATAVVTLKWDESDVRLTPPMKESGGSTPICLQVTAAASKKGSDLLLKDESSVVKPLNFVLIAVGTYGDIQVKTILGAQTCTLFSKLCTERFVVGL